MKNLWKKSLALVVIALGMNAEAQTRAYLNFLEDCSRSCSRVCRESAEDVQGALRQLNRDCRFTGGPVDPPRRGSSLEIFNSDSCSGEIIAIVRDDSRCSDLPATGTSAWAVRQDNECHNIKDMSPQEACYRFTGMNERGSRVRVYNNDSCRGELLSAIGRRSDCSQFPTSGTSAWGIEINGTCHNIFDMSEADACRRFKDGVSDRAVQIYNSDSCSKDLLAVVHSRRGCEELPANGTQAWGVKIDGVCQNITDTSVRDACLRFAP